MRGYTNGFNETKTNYLFFFIKTMNYYKNIIKSEIKSLAILLEKDLILNQNTMKDMQKLK